MKKILVVSCTPWNANNSVGNTYANLFDGMDDCIIAHIYCADGADNDPKVSRAYQITEKQLVLNRLGRLPVAGGEVAVQQIADTGETLTGWERSFMSFAKKQRWMILFWAREAIWKLGRWNNDSLAQFIREFGPDLVFVNLYDNVYMNRVDLAVQRLAGVPIVGYIWDDYYTLHQFSLSPFYWANRLYFRRLVRRLIDRCSRLYVISDLQKQEYDRIFQKDCHLLTKGGVFEGEHPAPKAPGRRLQLLYTGNIGAGRWRSLALLSRVIRRINASCPAGQGLELTIYTATPATRAMKQQLNCPGAVRLAGRIPYREVAQKQAEADLLVHVEPTGLAHRWESRLSFSTKLIDYMQAYRPILAYGLLEQASLAHLKAKDAAFVATNEAELERTLREILARPALLEEYAAKGWACGAACHDIRRIHALLRQDFEEVCNAGCTD